VDGDIVGVVVEAGGVAWCVEVVVDGDIVGVIVDAGGVDW